MEVDSRLLLLILCGFPWETIESVIELLKKHPTYPFLKRSGPIETPMSPGRGLTRDGWKTTYCYSVTLSLIWAVKADKFMGRLIP